MTKNLFLVGIISLLLFSLTSCEGKDENSTKITIDTSSFAMNQNGRITIPFHVDPISTNASTMIVGLENFELKTDDPNVGMLYPSMESVTKNIIGDGKWVATIKLVTPDNKDFVPKSGYKYNYWANICLYLNGSSYSNFFKLTYDYPLPQ